MLAITSLTDNFNLSHKNIYTEIEKIKWGDKYYRKDIAYKVLNDIS